MAEKSNPGLKAIITGAVFGIASSALGFYTMYGVEAVDAETNISSAKSDSSLTAAADMSEITSTVSVFNAVMFEVNVVDNSFTFSFHTLFL